MAKVLRESPLVPQFVPADREVIFQSENGLVGVGPPPHADDIDPDLIDASKEPVTLVCGGPTDGAGNNLDNVEVDIETAPFRAACQDYSRAKFESLLRKKAIVLAAVGERRNGISRICKRTHAPCVYITEFSLGTRLDIIKADRLGVLRSAKRSLSVHRKAVLATRTAPRDSNLGR